MAPPCELGSIGDTKHRHKPCYCGILNAYIRGDTWQHAARRVLDAQLHAVCAAYIKRGSFIWSTCRHMEEVVGGFIARKQTGVGRVQLPTTSRVKRSILALKCDVWLLLICGHKVNTREDIIASKRVGLAYAKGFVARHRRIHHYTRHLQWRQAQLERSYLERPAPRELGPQLNSVHRTSTNEYHAYIREVQVALAKSNSVVCRRPDFRSRIFHGHHIARATWGRCQAPFKAHNLGVLVYGPGVGKH